MSSGRSNGANGTHVRTTVNMNVAIVFMIISDEVAVKATRRSLMCKALRAGKELGKAAELRVNG